MKEDIKYPENLPDNIKAFLESSDMSPEIAEILLTALEEHYEKLEKEEIEKLRSGITHLVSAMSVNEFKKLINKVKKNSKEAGFFTTVKPNKKDAITVVFIDNSWNEMEITFEFVDYVDKGVSIFISPDFRYGPLIDSDFEDFLRKNNPESQKLKKMDNKTKIEMLTNIRNLIVGCKNS